MNLEGQIINLTKLAFEKDSPHKEKILERAYLLSLDPKLSSELKTVTSVNLGSYYSKQNLDFRAICVLTETLSVLKPENIWEKSVLLLNLAKLKSSLNYSKDSLKDLLQCLSLLSKVESKDLNFFTVLIVLHFNLSVEFSKIQKFSKSEKHSALAKTLSFEYLGPENKLFQFLVNFSKKTDIGSLSRRSRVSPSPYKSPKNLPMTTRSKSSLKDGKTIYKKFDKISQSFDLVSLKNKERIKKIKKFQAPLEALLEEDEHFSTSYPKFTLESCKSCKESDGNSALRSTFNRDPDPEPLEKDLSLQVYQAPLKKKPKQLKKVLQGLDFQSQGLEDTAKINGFETKNKGNDSDKKGKAVWKITTREGL